MNVSNILKALGDPTRLRIMMLLAGGELCVCDVVELLQVPQPTVSRHMGILKTAELVSDRRSRKWVHYRLSDAEPGRRLFGSIEQYLAEQEPYASDRRRVRERLAEKRLEELRCE